MERQYPLLIDFHTFRVSALFAGNPFQTVTAEGFGQEFDTNVFLCGGQVS